MPSPALSTVPLPPEPEGEGVLNTGSVSFPSSAGDHAQDAESSSSKLTSSDKLSALPMQSSPNLNRLRGTTRSIRHSLEAATTSPSLPSIDSSPVTHARRLFPSISGASESESSVGKDTPKQRVSFDSDRASLPANLQNIHQVIASRTVARSDSALAHVSTGGGGSPGGRTRPTVNPVQPEGNQTPATRSPTPSRAASPFRRFLQRAHSRDEPFIPVDPFKLRAQWFTSPTSTPQRHTLELNLDCEDTLKTCLPLPVTCEVSQRKLRTCGTVIRHFFLDTLPRQIYLHILLKLPALYFSRVARIFEDAEVSKHEIQRMIDICAPFEHDPESTTQIPLSASGQGLGTTRRGETILPYPEEWIPPTVTPALARFKSSWEQFIDSLLREWKTLNLVSALLCTAILTMFQVPEAAGDPFTRWAAIFSLIFALMSLTYGCMYIVQFGTMRSMYKASRWAEEARKTRTFVWWNVWVLLATPAIWLAWSMIAFVIAILSFVWRSGASSDPPDGNRTPLSPNEALAVRVVVTFIFCMGILHFALIIQTFRSYSGRRHHRRFKRDENTGDERTTGNWDQRPRERQESGKAQGYEERGREKGSNMEVPSGLGLTGLSNSLNTFGSASAVLIEENEPEKRASGSIRNDESARASAEGGLGGFGSRLKVSPKL